MNKNNMSFKLCNFKAKVIREAFFKGLLFYIRKINLVFAESIRISKGGFDMGLMSGNDYTIKNMLIKPRDFYTVMPSEHGNGTLSLDKDHFIYVYEGQFIYSIEKHVYIVQPHQLAFIPRRKAHSRHVTFCDNFKAIEGIMSFYFNDDHIRMFDFFDLMNDDYVLPIHNYEKLEACLHSYELNPDFSIGVSNSLQRIATLAEILSIYFENLQHRNKKRTEWEKVLTYMSEHLDKEVSLDILAKLLFLHPNYLLRKFKKDFGISPIKYFKNLRIEKAIELLANTDMLSADIAGALGIDDPNYFSYFFKTSTGISPRKFRECLQQMRALSAKTNV